MRGYSAAGASLACARKAQRHAQRTHHGMPAAPQQTQQRAQDDCAHTYHRHTLALDMLAAGALETGHGDCPAALLNSRRARRRSAHADPAYGPHRATTRTQPATIKRGSKYELPTPRTRTEAPVADQQRATVQPRTAIQTSPSAPGVVDVRKMASNDAKAHWTTSRPWCESAAVPLVERGRRFARSPAAVTPGRHSSQRRRCSSPHPSFCRNDRNKAQLLTAPGIATQGPIAATTQRTNLRNTRAWASRVSLRCSLAKRVAGLFPDLNHA
jgi:hypothetical protein